MSALFATDWPSSNSRNWVSDTHYFENNPQQSVARIFRTVAPSERRDPGFSLIWLLKKLLPWPLMIAPPRKRPLLALSGLLRRTVECPLSGLKRTRTSVASAGMRRRKFIGI